MSGSPGSPCGATTADAGGNNGARLPPLVCVLSLVSSSQTPAVSFEDEEDAPEGTVSRLRSATRRSGAPAMQPLA